LNIDVVRPQDLSPADVAAWEDLQAADPTFDSPYLSPHWAIAVERAQSTQGMSVKVAIVRENGRPVGFMPVRVCGMTAMPAGAPMCDYQALVCDAGLKVDVRQIIAALGVSRFDFSAALAAHPPLAAHIRGRGQSFVAQLPNGYEAFTADKSIFKDLGRRRRKAEREVGSVTFTAFSRSQADLDKLIAWKRDQYKATNQTDIFEARWPTRLLNDLFQGRDPNFGGTLFTLHLGDRLAAVQFNLRGRQTVHCWIIAHDAEFEPYSPGILLFQDILRWMDATPYSVLDFGPGDYRFKRQLSTATIEVGHGFVGRPSPVTLVRQAAYGLRAAAEALPLGKVSELPGKAMRRVDLLRGLR